MPPSQLTAAFAPDLRQREINDLLKLIGPEPVTYFFDCCRIMSRATGVEAGCVPG